MKKSLVWLIVSMFILTIPVVLFAKEPISEYEMDSITAQEGVTIEFGGDNFYQTHFSILGNFGPELQSWGDSDGCTTCGGYTGAGWVGFKNASMDPFGSYLGTPPGTGPEGSFIAMYSKMTIDIGTSAGVTQAFIGLPSALIHPAGITQTFTMGNTKDFADGQENLGTMYTSEFALLVNPTKTGYMSISNHGASGDEGVEIGFGGMHPFMAGGYPQGVIVSIPGKAIIQSWGDADGFSVAGADYSDAGYVGAKGMTVADGYVFGHPSPTAWPDQYLNILISGTMSVDVGTDAGGTTAVVIGMPTMKILPGSSITQPIALGNIRDFSDNQQLLGRAYIGGIDISPSGSIAISAH